jgi:predicted homoserine dehydrogenase-like protein
MRWGVYVTFRAEDAASEDYVRRCFGEYGFSTDPTGRYAAMYKPYHAIGLELGISIASVGLRAEPTGVAIAWHGDVVATAKRDLAAGEILDGEGGHTVYGKLLPAARSIQSGGLPLGLAHGVTLRRAIAAHAAVRWDDVAIDATSDPSGSGAKWRKCSPARIISWCPGTGTALAHQLEHRLYGFLKSRFARAPWQRRSEVAATAATPSR